MKIRYLLGVAATAAAAVHQPAFAADAPSAYLRCDGSPNNVTGAETAGRVLAAATLIGLLLPQGEGADIGERRSGQEGVAACTEALASEGNDLRRAQLILARAVHHIDAGSYDAAIADAQRVAQDRPAFAGTEGFRLSLGLSAMEIEATALIAAGRAEQGIAKARDMSAAAPYDVVTAIRTAKFMQLGSTYGPDDAAYFDRLVRLYPFGLNDRANARQAAGDWRGAADDYETLERLIASVINRPAWGPLAQAALVSALAGQSERADAFATRAEAAIAVELEKTPNANVSSARELLDLHRIVRRAQNSSSAEARLLFAARSGWTVPSASAVGEVSRLLRRDAPAEQLTGLLAAEPGSFRADAVAAQRRVVVAGGTDPKRRFDVIRAFTPDRDFTGYSGNVWRDGRSRYFAREENEEVHGRLVNMSRDGFGVASGYALLLHSAVVAQREGRTSFMILPPVTQVGLGHVRTGNAGDEGMIEGLTFSAEEVIADLTPLIPRARRR